MKAKTPEIPLMAIPTIKLPELHKNTREFFIEYLIKTYNFNEGAELGIWKGRTFLHLLKSCPSLKLHGVDLWKPQPNNDGPENYIDWSHEENEKHVRDNAEKFNDRAIIYKMWTHEAAQFIPDKSLDFIFIDADHSSESVRNDIEKWLDKIKNDGMIIGHDYNWETVRTVADSYFTNLEVGPDNIWFAWKDGRSYAERRTTQ